MSGFVNDLHKTILQMDSLAKLYNVGDFVGPFRAHINCNPCFRYRHNVIGAEERNRTSDLLITNQLLYQLSYPGLG